MARNPQQSPAAAEAPAARNAQPAEKSRLRQRYERDVVPALLRDFNYQNPMQVPRLAKVSVNVGVGESIANSKALDAAVRDVTAITGQKPITIKARKSIAQFKLRAGQHTIGVKVTLRGNRMWEFLDRLLNAALPRTRDFHGVPSRSFDGRGNYTLGLREQLIFPEINYDQVDKARGLEISIITTARSDKEARRLLELLGMPFQREGDAQGPAAAAARRAARVHPPLRAVPHLFPPTGARRRDPRRDQGQLVAGRRRCVHAHE